MSRIYIRERHPRKAKKDWVTVSGRVPFLSSLECWIVKNEVALTGRKLCSDYIHALNTKIYLLAPA